MYRYFGLYSFKECCFDSNSIDWNVLYDLNCDLVIRKELYSNQMRPAFLYSGARVARWC